MAFAGFSDRELKIIAWRTNGIKPPQIGKLLGISSRGAHDALWRIYRKIGAHDVALLTRWAIENALDVPLGPETWEERPHPGKPVPRKRVRLKTGLIKRMKLPLTGGRMPRWKADAKAVAQLSKQLGMKIPRSSRKARKPTVD